MIRAPVGEVNVARADARRRCADRRRGERRRDPARAAPRPRRAGRRGPASAAAGGGGTAAVGRSSRSLPRYVIVKDKLDRPNASLDAVYDALRAAFPDAEADTQDGLRLAWPDRWVHVRPSGTEPIVRVIAEAPTEDAGAGAGAARRASRSTRWRASGMATRSSSRGTHIMCGIVGYVGPQRRDAAPPRGLKRLEYRGYDSAGVAIMNGKGVETRKAAGKISQLEAADRARARSTATLGIAHTRWATHGAPNECNAHPHLDCTGTIAVVHNGIIENCDGAQEAMLEERGLRVRVRDRHRSARAPDRGSCSTATSRRRSSTRSRMVEGTYGIAVISSDDPDKIVAARKGSPLLVGLGEGEYFVASDVVGDPRAHAPGRLSRRRRDGACSTRDGYQRHRPQRAPTLEKSVSTHRLGPRPDREGRLRRTSCSRRSSSSRRRSRTRCAAASLDDEGTSKLGGLNLTRRRAAQRSTTSSSPRAARAGTRR